MDQSKHLSIVSDTTIRNLEDSQSKASTNVFSSDSFEERAAEAVNAWVDEVELARQEECISKIASLDPHLTHLANLINVLEDAARTNTRDLAVIHQSLSAFDERCKMLETNDHPTREEIDELKAEASRLSIDFKAAKDEQARIAREQEDVKLAIDEAKVEFDHSQDSFEKLKIYE